MNYSQKIKLAELINQNRITDLLECSVSDGYLSEENRQVVIAQLEKNGTIDDVEFQLTDTGYIIHSDDSIWIQSDNLFFHSDHDSDHFLLDEITDEYIHRDDVIQVRDRGGYIHTHTDNCNSYNSIHYFENQDCYVTERYMEYNSIIVMRCGTLECADDVYYWESDGEYHYEEEETRGKINSYSYKPMPIFKMSKNESKPVFFGIELEVENETEDISNNKMSEILHNKIGEFAYMKTDGSLSNGFEIVTHPMSLGYIQGKKEIFENVLSELSSNGFRSYNSRTCGMHIHISKENFTTWQLFRFMQFFQQNKDFIVKLSQRDISNLNKWAALEDTDRSQIIYKTKCAKKNKDNFSRYSAININNRYTVEIRIFRGTLSPGSFFKNIEFCAALFEFTRDNVVTDILSFKKFISDKSEYKNLAKFIKLKSI